MSSSAAPQTWTIGSLLAWAGPYLAKHEVQSPRLSAELLLAKVLKLKRLDLYLRFEQPLSRLELNQYKELILRRKKHEPVAYILGSREFYGLEIKVGPGVLIPRPETEHLVEEALKALASCSHPRILDLCTGSGAVLLALLHELSSAQGLGLDISAEALAYARQNAQNLNLSARANWLQGDLWQGLQTLPEKDKIFDLITANPPYVREDELAGLMAEVRDYEPRRALAAGPDGLAATRLIVENASEHLKAGGQLHIETSPVCAPALSRIHAPGLRLLNIIPDLAGHDRIICWVKES